ncbi:hypothetical protein JQC91_17280 [Jannaschia sp. Os4]|uniref:hypothetical protein n=1 Tax=Jannaschia sp. Os4 TaxID=2807617 RepID=UPI001939885F|nr:hypothetical protein [Jannaschia sp. Os4]MBM2578062.1 hypothetical protein [Jannaschia sp. Os4]
MALDIFVSVDGTGPYSDGVYAADFEDSHVSRLHREWHTHARFYRRGPGALGTATGSLGYDMFMRARHHWHRAGREGGSRIFLCGYSRGAAAAIVAARYMQRHGMRVHHLMLFDAVDRSPSPDTETIPANVRICSHARRAPAAASREFFGNCGTRAEDGAATSYHEETFHCTHGAVGGMPWEGTAQTGRVEEMRPGLARGLNRIGEILSDASRSDHSSMMRRDRPRANLYRAYRATGVTASQEAAGAARSWDWMRAELTMTKALHMDDAVVEADRL